MGIRGCSFSAYIIHPRARSLCAVTFLPFFWLSKLIRNANSLCDIPSIFRRIFFLLFIFHARNDIRVSCLRKEKFYARNHSFVIHFLKTVSTAYSIIEGFLALSTAHLAFLLIFLAPYVSPAFYSVLVPKEGVRADA